MKENKKELLQVLKFTLFSKSLDQGGESFFVVEKIRDETLCQFQSILEMIFAEPD